MLAFGASLRSAVITMLGRLPRGGEVLRLTRAASPQFNEPISIRVIRVMQWPTYTGWKWIEAYELDSVGEAVDKRMFFVRLDGLTSPGTPITAPRLQHRSTP